MSNHSLLLVKNKKISFTFTQTLLLMSKGGFYETDSKEINFIDIYFDSRDSVTRTPPDFTVDIKKPINRVVKFQLKEVTIKKTTVAGHADYLYVVPGVSPGVPHVSSALAPAVNVSNNAGKIVFVDDPTGVIVQQFPSEWFSPQVCGPQHMDTLRMQFVSPSGNATWGNNDWVSGVMRVWFLRN